MSKETSVYDVAMKVIKDRRKGFETRNLTLTEVDAVTCGGSCVGEVIPWLTDVDELEAALYSTIYGSGTNIENRLIVAKKITRRLERELTKEEVCDITLRDEMDKLFEFNCNIKEIDKNPKARKAWNKNAAAIEMIIEKMSVKPDMYK